MSATLNHSPTKVSFDAYFPDNVIALTSKSGTDFQVSSANNRLPLDQLDEIENMTGLSEKRVLSVIQVHGHRILKATHTNYAEIQRSEADGLVTSEKNLILTVRTADCLPIFLYDEKKGAIGLLHAGWKSTRKQIAHHAISLMKKEFRSKQEDIKVAFGPSIQKCCYEVSEKFLFDFPIETQEVNHGYFFDLPLANKNQLIESGIEEKNIYNCGICTCCDKTYYSYRREGQLAGRMISLIVNHSKY